MQHTALHSPIGSSDMEVDPIFNVVIAYEDFEAGKLAKETYDFLVDNLRHECRFANQMWKFDVLAIPKLREMAAKDALSADIIIISCRGTHDICADVKAWINSWVDEQNTAIALVALFGQAGSDNDSHHIRDYLEEIAKRGGMEFFAQSNAVAVNRLNQTFTSNRGGKRDDKALSALAGVIQREQNFPRWGINE